MGRVVSQHTLHWGVVVSQHALQVSRSTPRGEVEGSDQGRFSPGPHGGGCIPACTDTDPPTATAAGGTHPTGMHSCLEDISIALLGDKCPWFDQLQSRKTFSFLIKKMLIYHEQSATKWFLIGWFPTASKEINGLKYCKLLLVSLKNFYEATVLDFWWRLLWLSKPGWIPSFACFLSCVQWILQINLWCYTCWPLDGQSFLSSPLLSIIRNQTNHQKLQCLEIWLLFPWKINIDRTAFSNGKKFSVKWNEFILLF